MNNNSGDFSKKNQLTIVSVNQWKTRSAYQDKQGEIYLDCSKCNLIIHIKDFASTKKGFYGKVSSCKPCNRKHNYTKDLGLVKLIKINGLEAELELVDVSLNTGRKKYKDTFGNIYFDCRTCGEVIPETGFYKKESTFGVTSQCKGCILKKNRTKDYQSLVGTKKEHDINGKIMELTIYKVAFRGRKGYKDEDGNIYVECTICKKPKLLDNFYIAKGYFLNANSECKECDPIKQKKYYEENKEERNAYKTKWARENRNSRYESCAKWIRENRDKARNYTRNRRAKKRALPDTLTHEENNEILKRYNFSCALTGEVDKLNLDHIIPLNIGHGGTTYENMLPLSDKLNSSKSDRNIFEWAVENHEYNGFTLERFYQVMTEVAERHKMPLEDYEEYVNWCFDNPNDLTKIPRLDSQKNRKEKLERAIHLYVETNVKIKDIQEITGVSDSALYEALKNRGIERCRLASKKDELPSGDIQLSLF
ncbi:hypothetical protein PDJ99_24730 [Bacillus cereus]|nr:hypothetical protein [Bacillus cereus]